jgi:hypothetical protein
MLTKISRYLQPNANVITPDGRYQNKNLQEVRKKI